MPTINLGRVAIVPKGEWSSTEPYKRLDLVTYNDAAYICEVANTGVTPTPSAPEWIVITYGVNADTINSLKSTQTHYKQKFYPEFIEDRGDGEPFSYPAGFILWYEDGAGTSGYFKADVNGTTTIPTDTSEWSPYDLTSGGNVSASTNVFSKDEVNKPAFKATGSSVVLDTDIFVGVGVGTYKFTSGTSVVLPTLNQGTDYAIYATSNQLVASENFTVPDGFTESNSRRIGGFHYGADGFKEYSFYDLKFRPACQDPRGMVRHFSNRFWVDIYLTNTTPETLGTSAYNAQIADDGSTPKIPTIVGGDGSQQYSNFSQYTASEVLSCFGKRLPNYSEFQALAKGSVTGHANGTDPVTTQHDPDAMSMIGCEQVSGHMWQWGIENWDRGNGTSDYNWYSANTNNQGDVYAIGTIGVGASIFGARWDSAGLSGSASSEWDFEPWTSLSGIGARGLCDHLQLV